MNFKLVKTESAVAPYQVVCPDGMPHLALTLFAAELHQSHSASSVHVYLRTVLHFADWLQNDAVAIQYDWHLLNNPAAVRSALRQYLRAEGNCKIVVRPDNLGLKSVYVSSSDHKHINVRTFLAALKMFYESAAENDFYTYSNPLIHPEAAQIYQQIKKAWREETLATEGRRRMPSVSGVDPPTGRFRLSENYFKYNGESWQPKTVDSADFPCQVFKAGADYGWSLREECIARMLFESGARISEILSLTAGDWGANDFGHRLHAQNKGSHHKRIKTIIVSQATVKLLRRYFDSPERQKAAREPILFRHLPGIKRTDQAKLDRMPLFLNQRGNQMTAALFRDYYWKPALVQAGIDADPHTCRHWFVTSAINTIETVSTSKQETERRKEELIGYMSWRAGERTLKAYEHVSRDNSFQKTIAGIHGKLRQNEKKYAQSLRTKGLPNGETQSLPQSCSSSPARADLAFILGDDCV